jgi:hypothetical protein
MGVFVNRSAAIKKAAGISEEHAGEEGENGAEGRRQVARMPEPLRTRFWRSELMVMLCENALFTTFVSGMASGLPRR